MSRPPYPAATILQVARKIHDTTVSFADHLAKFGINAASYDKLDQDIESTRKLTTSGESRVTLRGRTVAKDEVLDETVDWAADLALRCDIASAKHPELTGVFPSRKFADSRGSETAMGELMPELIQIAKDYAVQLADAGQDETVIADGETLADNLEKADAAQESSKVTGTSATKTRHDALNNLVAQVNTITRTGRRVFRNQPDKREFFKSPWPRGGDDDDGDDPETE